MNSLNGLKCDNYEQFIIELDHIEKNLQSKNNEKDVLSKISDFIDKNQELFVSKKSTAIRFDFIATKVRKISVDDPLISKLQDYTSRLLPVDKLKQFSKR